MWPSPWPSTAAAVSCSRGSPVGSLLSTVLLMLCRLERKHQEIAFVSSFSCLHRADRRACLFDRFCFSLRFFLFFHYIFSNCCGFSIPNLSFFLIFFARIRMLSGYDEDDAADARLVSLPTKPTPLPRVQMWLLTTVFLRWGSQLPAFQQLYFGVSLTLLSLPLTLLLLLLLFLSLSSSLTF